MERRGDSVRGWWALALLLLVTSQRLSEPVADWAVALLELRRSSYSRFGLLFRGTPDDALHSRYFPSQAPLAAKAARIDVRELSCSDHHLQGAESRKLPASGDRKIVDRGFLAAYELADR